MFNFKMRTIICVACRVWSGNLRNCIKKTFWRLVFQNFIKDA